MLTLFDETKNPLFVMMCRLVDAMFDFSSGFATLRLDAPIGTLIGSTELSWLKTMLMADEFSFLLPTDVRARLLARLKDVEPLYRADAWRKLRFQRSGEVPRGILYGSTLRLIVAALSERKKLRAADKILIPCRLEYDPFDDRYAVIVWDEQSDRAEKIFVERLSDLRLLDDNIPADVEDRLQIGCLLYSNLQNKIVEPLDDIYALLQLTAGVEEFIQFGSVKALNDYYDAQDQSRLSDGLNRLRAAMENFSEQIKLCHYGQFERAIKNLHEAVHDFKPSDGNAQDLLMARLIDRIREMYAGTIKDRLVDDVELIRWCVKNDYVQQALTLYTERVPEYIGEHGWIKMSLEELKKLDERVANDKLHRNRWFYFLNEYPSSASDDKDRSLGLKPYAGAIKEKALNAIRKNNFNYDEWWVEVDARLKERDLTCLDESRLRAQLELLQKLRAEPSPLMTLDDPMLDPIRKLIDALTSELTEMPKPKLRFNRILNFISTGLKGEKLIEYFPNIAARPSAPFKVLLSQNVFSLRIDQEKFLSIMDKCLRLKKERNQTNHAREDSGDFITARELKAFINVGLDELSEVINQR